MKRDFKGVWIPKEIWESKEINMNCKGLLTEIDSLDNNSNDGCYATNEYFAEFLGISQRCVTDCIAKLEILGFIKVSGFNGRKRTVKSLLKRKLQTNMLENKQNLPGSIENSAMLHSKICQADKQNLPGSIANLSKSSILNNPMNNTINNPMNKKRIASAPSLELPAYIELSRLLYTEHKKYSDNFLEGKNIESILNSWAKDIKLLIEKDRYDIEKVRKVIVWCQQWEGNKDFSWRYNILSGKKLRLQFETLYGQYLQYNKIEKKEKRITYHCKRCGNRVEKEACCDVCGTYTEAIPDV